VYSQTEIYQNKNSLLHTYIEIFPQFVFFLVNRGREIVEASVLRLV